METGKEVTAALSTQAERVLNHQKRQDSHISLSLICLPNLQLLNCHKTVSGFDFFYMQLQIDIVEFFYQF